MTYPIRVFAYVLLAGSLGCDLAGPADTSVADALEGRRFVDAEVTGRELVPGSSIWLSFGDGELSASAGCNSMSGPFTVSDGRLHMEGLAATEIGCEPIELHTQEDWLGAFLTSKPQLLLEEPHLVLSDDDVTITLTDREVADPDRELVGPEWKLDGIIEMGGFGFGSWPDTILRFSKDGTFAIDSGCPTAQGSFTIDGQNLTFSSVETSVEGCDEESEFASDVATSVLSDGTITFEIDAARLTLMRGDLGLSFRALE